MALSLAAAQWVQSDIETDALRAFQVSSERVATEVTRRFATPVYGLNGLKAMYATRAQLAQSGRISRSEFRSYVAARDLPKEFPGVRGLGYIERVSVDGREAFVEAEQLDGAPGFAIRQLDQRDLDPLYVIKLIEPAAQNAGALGLDTGSETHRRAAIEQAIDSAEPTITANITLVQDNRKTPGVLLFVPIYDRDPAPLDAPQRRQALVGVAYAPIVFAELLAGLAEVAGGRVDVALFDAVGTELPASTLAFDSIQAVAQAAGAPPAAHQSHFQAIETLLLPGRAHTLRVRSSPSFDAAIDSHTRWMVLAGGVLMSAMLAALVRQQATGRRRAEALAEQMTADLGRLALVAQRTSDAVIITDARRRITWVNEGFERVSGYTLAETIGQSPGQLLQFEGTDAATVARMREALDEGQPFSGQLLNRSKTGQAYWIELEIQPLRGSDGALTGFMAIESDITERKATLQALDQAREELSRLAMVAQRTSNAVIITDRDLRITWVNEGFTRTYGYSSAEALGRTRGELLGSPNCPSEALETLRRSAQAGTGCRVEVVNSTADGRDLWIDTEVQPAVDAQGQTTGFIEIASDVTSAKRAARQLVVERNRLDRIIQGTQAGTWEHDLRTDEDRINAFYAGMLDYTVEECSQLMRDSFLTLVHPDDLNHVEKARNAHLHGLTREFQSEYRMRHKAGHWVWMQSRGMVSERDAQGTPLMIAGIQLDISDRKQAEEELNRSRQRLTNIIEGTHVGTWEWNVETGETVFNERWASIVGYTLEELGRTTIETWSRFAHPDDLSRSSRLLEQHFNGEAAAYECESRMQHKDGHWVWVLDRGKLFSRSDDGRPRWMAGTHMDITERKQAEAALRASQALLDQTGLIGGVGGWEMDLATQVTHWTDQTCRIHEVDPGYQATVDEGINFYAPEAQPLVAAAVQHSVATGEGFDLEVPFITAKGRAIWVRTVGVAEFVDGKPVRLVGAFQDVTARRTLEAELREKNELVNSVLENLPCGLSVFDANLELVAVNREFKRLLGFPESLFEGGRTRFEEVIRFNAARGEYGQVGVDTTVQAIVDRARGPTVDHQFERVRPDGTALEVHGAPMPGGGFITTYTDISARKQAEAEVARSAALLRAMTVDLKRLAVVARRTKHAVIITDVQSRITWVNEGFERMTGYSAAEALGQLPRALLQDASTDAATAAALRTAMGAGQPFQGEILNRAKDGRHYWLALDIQPLYDDDGSHQGFTSVESDITELVQATEAARAASTSKSQFLANMSHEIRTPMNAILGMLALLRKTELTPRQADYAGKTEGAARSLLGLLNDILDFSKVEAGKMTLDPHPFRIDELMRNLSVILSAGIGRKPVEVLFDIDPEVPRHLVGDAMRLQQVLINLGGNAIKFTATGEVVLSVTRLRQDDDGVTLQVAVRDTGIGIAPENQARIFSGFTQAEASTTRRFGGTGLGVAISQRLVALMGGELHLESAVGQGSRFHFSVTLPLAPEAQADVRVPTTAGAAPALRALVVDDNATARDVLCRMGRSLGWAVDLAESGEQAVARMEARAAEGGPYQAVFVDWQMPGLDGFGTAQRMRELNLAGNAPLVVMVTAHGREMLEQRSPTEQQLLDGFLVKPITASMLLDAVSDARAAKSNGQPAARASTPSGHRLAGLRLLVVEDNANNQQVARELLEDEGASVQIAQHGQEAVEAVAAADPQFDVVLMDLQMPVMDGLTASRCIRGELGLTALPIVAMTANAMTSDREACLAAGMNDHVGKPFDLDHLVGVLRRQAGLGEAAQADPAAPTGLPGVSPATAQAADAAGIALDNALARLGGKREVYERMLRTFIADLADMPGLLQGFASQGDTGNAERTLHTLKGLAATLGADRLARLAGDAEKQLAAQPTPPVLAEVVAQTVHAVQQAGPALQALQQVMQAEAPQAAGGSAVLDTAALKQALEALAALLKDSDMGALAALSRLQQVYGNALGERLSALDSAINALDFDPALDHCQQLIEDCTT